MTSPAVASEYANPWTHDGKILSSEDIGDNYGFVYLITDTLTNKKYIGKKLFWNKKTKVVKKKKKRTVVESDWKDYYGSNLELIAEVDKSGGSRFRREVLHLCKSKGECNYWEAHEQFARNVLLDDDYYNAQIWVRVHRSHLKNLRLNMEKDDGKISIEANEEGDSTGLHGGSVQENVESTEGDRAKEKGRARRAQP